MWSVYVHFHIFTQHFHHLVDFYFKSNLLNSSNTSNVYILIEIYSTVNCLNWQNISTRFDSCPHLLKLSAGCIYSIITKFFFFNFSTSITVYANESCCSRHDASMFIKTAIKWFSADEKILLPKVSGIQFIQKKESEKYFKTDI